MFQERTIKKEESELNEIRKNRKEEHCMVIPLNLKDVRVVQRIVLSPRQLHQMFQERVIKSINYQEIARNIKEEYIPESAYIHVFYSLLVEEIRKINLESFSHGNEKEKNYHMLVEKLNEYIDENSQQIIRNIQIELNDIRDGCTDIEVEQKEESIYTIIYHTDTLKEYCEADSNIMGTINNLSNHYHGTPQRMKIDGRSVLHQHVTGSTALAFCKNGNNTIEIMAYGIKSDSAPKGSGGYDWETEPE